MKLYLVYRVRQDGGRTPEAIMPISGADLPNAGKLYDALVRDDNPEMARKDGETWEFTAQEDAPLDDWEQIAPADAKSAPSAISGTVDDSDLLHDNAASLLKHQSEETPG
jgi:hypothetical protein